MDVIYLGKFHADRRRIHGAERFCRAGSDLFAGCFEDSPVSAAVPDPQGGAHDGILYSVTALVGSVEKSRGGSAALPSDSFL